MALLPLFWHFTNTVALIQQLALIKHSCWPSLLEGAAKHQKSWVSFPSPHIPSLLFLPSFLHPNVTLPFPCPHLPSLSHMGSGCGACGGCTIFVLVLCSFRILRCPPSALRPLLLSISCLHSSPLSSSGSSPLLTSHRFRFHSSLPLLRFHPLPSPFNRGKITEFFFKSTLK